MRKLKAITHGSVFDTITRDTFVNIEVAIPDIKTQHRIAKMLADIDDKVENNQRINNNLAAHLCVEQTAATQLRQMPKPDGCLHTEGEISGRGGNEKTPQVFSSLRAA